RIHTSTKLLVRRIRLQGIRRPVPTPEDAIAELGDLAFNEDPVSRGGGKWPRYIVGAPEQVRDQLTPMASDLDLTERMIITVVHDYEARMRSYKLLAEVFGLGSGAADFAASAT